MMDWNASIGLILSAAFGIGMLHALEPGHGKSIMGAYLVASRGGIRHAFLLGIVVTVTHTLVVFLLAIGALALAGRFASAQITSWLQVVSGLIVLGVGVWMLLTSFGFLRRPGAVTTQAAHGHGGDHHHHKDAQVHRHDHDHDQVHEHGLAHSHHGHSHDVHIPAGKDPLSVWTLMVVGASGGLVPCPAALTALLAAVNLGRPAVGLGVVVAMSVGIASTLIAIGILFVQAGRLASRWFGGRVLAVYVPRASALLITLLGTGLLIRSFTHTH